ncbi:unnamed protein product [Urochloa humidicola]
MDGIEGLLARDFGMRPQGKAAPMAGAASRLAAGSTAGTAAAWSNQIHPGTPLHYPILRRPLRLHLPRSHPCLRLLLRDSLPSAPGTVRREAALGPAEVQGVVAKACGGHPWPMDSAPDRHKRD